MLSQNSFSAKKALQGENPTGLWPPCSLSVSLKCYEVIYAKTGDLVRENVGGAWHVLLTYYSIHACASSKASSMEGVRLSRFKSQLWHFTKSMATVPDSTWKKNYHSIDFIIKIIIYRTTNKMKVDYSASRLLVWFCYYHMLGLR